MKTWLLLAAFATTVCALGCGPGDPHTIPVSGTITFAGQAPPSRVVLTFVCTEVAGDGNKQNGTAEAQSDGSFQATSFHTGDGLVPGKYRVNIECWQTAPTMDRPGGVSHIPRTFQPPELVVPGSESRVQFDFDVPAS